MPYQEDNPSGSPKTCSTLFCPSGMAWLGYHSSNAKESTYEQLYIQ